MRRRQLLTYAWTDLPLIALAIVLLIPLIVHLAGIVADFAADIRDFGP